jgi:hypothetical protein
MIHTKIAPTEQPDRLPIRELVDAYAHCPDRQLAEEQKSLFTADAHFVVYMDGQGSEPAQVLDGPEALTPVFDDLNRYEATPALQRSEHNRATRGPCDRREPLHRPPSLHRGQREQVDARAPTPSSHSTAPGCSRNATSASTGSRQSLAIPRHHGD